MPHTHTLHTQPTRSSFRFIFRLLVGCAAVVILCGFGLKNGCNTGASTKPVELTFWGVFDEKEAYQPLIEKYQTLHPNVKVTYSKLTIDRYEQDLIEALAAGRGPDLWMLQNASLPRHLDKIVPAPDTAISAAEVKQSFAQAAYDDFVLVSAPDKNGNQGTERVYGVPLYIDTLALYYNRDLLDSAGITSPPADWSAFAQQVRALTRTDDFGNITRAGAALGTATNVERGTDLLALLMLQNGTPMADVARRKASFDETVERADGTAFLPGLDALVFYTDFANPRKVVYTWDPTKPGSVDAFVNEQTAFLFHYQYIDASIRTRAPQLSYEVAPVPQIAGAAKKVAYANSWGHVVSKASPNQAEAWRFITFLAASENAQQFAAATNRPSSRKDILEAQIRDPDTSVFAQQALIARSWYQQDSALIEDIFSDMIDGAVLGTPAEQALHAAADQVTAVMRK